MGFSKQTNKKKIQNNGIHIALNTSKFLGVCYSGTLVDIKGITLLFYNSGS